jgi:type III secretion protein T
MGAGLLMDNQRGATSIEVADIFTGEESSPLGSIFFVTIVIVFFASGAFVKFMDLFYRSYIFWPPGSFIPDLFDYDTPLFLFKLLDWLMLQIMVIAGPVIVASLLTDISLGLINRFASQLNVFILSMSIKSAITMFILLFYYIIFVKMAPLFFLRMEGDFIFLRNFWN